MMPKILVVDDEPLIRRLVIHVLQADGYQVLEALDVSGAKDQFAHHSPDLVLTDLHMPSLDGVALVHWIRAQKAVPIVVMTASLVRDGIDAPMLIKPFTLRALTDIVRDTLQPQS
jgi:two-component system KDP operon response regulator KdpE